MWQSICTVLRVCAGRSSLLIQDDCLSAVQHCASFICTAPDRHCLPYAASARSSRGRGTLEQSAACSWTGGHGSSAVQADWVQGPSQLAGLVTSAVASVGGMHRPQGLPASLGGMHSPQGVPAICPVQPRQLQGSTAARRTGPDAAEQPVGAVCTVSTACRPALWPVPAKPHRGQIVSGLQAPAQECTALGEPCTWRTRGIKIPCTTCFSRPPRRRASPSTQTSTTGTRPR